MRKEKGRLAMKLEGKRVIILVEEIFNDQEFWYPYYRLREAGAEVVVVGSSIQAYTGTLSGAGAIE